MTLFILIYVIASKIGIVIQGIFCN